jgi:sulfur-oxidizing protein SoxY
MKRTPSSTGRTRRQVIAAATLAPAGWLALKGRPARATPAAMEAAIRDFVGEATITPGRVKLTLPALVENGNVVPLQVSVESPMTEADHVKAIAVFNERNPQPNVAVFHLSPRAGKAAVQTRIRLADSQRVLAVAQMSDGSFWSHSADVVVTLAACIEQL